ETAELCLDALLSLRRPALVLRTRRELLTDSRRGTPVFECKDPEATSETYFLESSQQRIRVPGLQVLSQPRRICGFAWEDHPEAREARNAAEVVVRVVVEKGFHCRQDAVPGSSL